MKQLNSIMTKNVLAATSLAFLVACGGSSTPAAEQETIVETYYGQEISSEEINDFDIVKEAVQLEGSTHAKLEGTILSTCAKKGCWMEMTTGDDDTLFVQFKDYGFFVPTEGAEGKHVIIEGEAFFDTLTVEQLQHYAEDAGKSAEEIAEITEEEYNIAFTAEGVIIQD